MPFVVGGVIILKLVAGVAWWIPPALIGAVAVAAMTAIGWAFLDSLRQRPGWENRPSTRFDFWLTELVPVTVGGLLATVTIIKYYQLVDPLPVWWVIAAHLAIGGAALLLVAWLFAFYFTQVSPQASDSRWRARRRPRSR